MHFPWRPRCLKEGLNCLRDKSQRIGQNRPNNPSTFYPLLPQLIAQLNCFIFGNLFVQMYNIQIQETQRGNLLLLPSLLQFTSGFSNFLHRAPPPPPISAISDRQRVGKPEGGGGGGLQHDVQEEEEVKQLDGQLTGGRLGSGAAAPEGRVGVKS